MFSRYKILEIHGVPKDKIKKFPTDFEIQNHNNQDTKKIVRFTSGIGKKNWLGVVRVK